MRGIKINLNKNYGDIGKKALKIIISFKGDKYGRVLDCKVAESSENKDFDQSVINALNTDEPYFEVLPLAVEKAVNQDFIDITLTFGFDPNKP